MPTSMRCFRSFFKHTWHPQQMESSSRFELTEPESRNGAGETELGEVTTVVPTTSTSAENMPCKNGGCKVWRARGDFRPESPWHVLKTIFLVTVVVALILWVIIYTLLSQYKIL